MALLDWFQLRLAGIISRIRRTRVVDGRGPLEGLRLRLPSELIPTYLDSPYEPDVVHALQSIVEPGHVCVDVGAHIGYFTLVMAKLTGGNGRVISLEAAPENAAIVAENVRLNQLDGAVQVKNLAASDISGERLRLFAGRKGRSSEWTASLRLAMREDGVTDRPTISVPTVALDDFFPATSRVDVVKLDIEGGEASAIAGMERLLRDAKPTLLVEYHGEVGWPGITALSDAGYEIETLEGVGLTFPASTREVPYQFIAKPSARPLSR